MRCVRREFTSGLMGLPQGSRSLKMMLQGLLLLTWDGFLGKLCDPSSLLDEADGVLWEVIRAEAELVASSPSCLAEDDVSRSGSDTSGWLLLSRVVVTLNRPLIFVASVDLSPIIGPLPASSCDPCVNGQATVSTGKRERTTC